jgi:hypothetical protein
MPLMARCSNIEHGGGGGGKGLLALRQAATGPRVKVTPHPPVSRGLLAADEHAVAQRPAQVRTQCTAQRRVPYIPEADAVGLGAYGSATRGAAGRLYPALAVLGVSGGAARVGCGDGAAGGAGGWGVGGGCHRGSGGGVPCGCGKENIDPVHGRCLCCTCAQRGGAAAACQVAAAEAGRPRQAGRGAGWVYPVGGAVGSALRHTSSASVRV